MALNNEVLCVFARRYRVLYSTIVKSTSNTYLFCIFFRGGKENTSEKVNESCSKSTRKDLQAIQANKHSSLCSIILLKLHKYQFCVQACRRRIQSLCF